MANEIKTKLLALITGKKQPVSTDNTSNDYFTEATSWADDLYTTAITQRNRWRAVCLFGCLPLLLLFMVWLTSLIPNQHVEPFLVHHYENGYVSVEPLHHSSINADWNQTASNLVRYLTNMMTYDKASYSEQYKLVMLLSSPEVAKQYMQEQSANNQDSPVNRLGTRSYRTLHIESVIQLDSESENDPAHNKTGHKNLAQVEFTITDHNRETGATHTEAKTAIMSWEYGPMPTNPEDAWKAWDGFTVTSYTLQQRNV